MKSVGLFYDFSRAMGTYYGNFPLKEEGFAMRQAEKHNSLTAKTSIKNQYYDKRAQVRNMGISGRRM